MLSQARDLASSYGYTALQALQEWHRAKGSTNAQPLGEATVNHTDHVFLYCHLAHYHAPLSNLMPPRNQIPCVVKWDGSSIKNITYTGILERLLKDFHNRTILCVLSAYQGQTDTLISNFKKTAKAIYEKTPVHLRCDENQFLRSTAPEYDHWISHGEIHSIMQASIAAKARGLHAVPLAGWQAGISTTAEHKSATIVHIDVHRLQQLIHNFDILFIAGFQGCDTSQLVTTLGRGTSDLTAVALASALKLPEVYIYTLLSGYGLLNDGLCP